MDEYFNAVFVQNLPKDPIEAIRIVKDKFLEYANSSNELDFDVCMNALFIAAQLFDTNGIPHGIKISSLEKDKVCLQILKFFERLPIQSNNQHNVDSTIRPLDNTSGQSTQQIG